MNNTRSQTADEADVIIIGSGIAGALAAAQLASKGIRVLILEAGLQVKRQDAVSRYRNNWRRDPQSAYERPEHALSPDQNSSDSYLSIKGEASYWCNYLRVVGGTTWHWTGMTPRFLPNDFDLFSRYGVGKDWPISYDDIEPYYLQAEQEMGVSGDSNDDHGSPRSGPYPMPAIEMPYSDQVISNHLEKYGAKIKVSPAARNSRPYKGRPACCGNNSCTPICPIGAQYNADTHIKSAIKYNAHLIENAVVHNINVDSSGNIKSLDYKLPDGKSHSLRARYYVMACNAIETPKLLLVSRSEYAPDGVANSSGLVGRGLMCHPAIAAAFLMSEPIYTGRGPQAVSILDYGRDGDFRSQHAAGKIFLSNTLDMQSYATSLIEEKKDWGSLNSRLEDYAVRYGLIGVELEQIHDMQNWVKPSSTEFDVIGIPKPEIHMEFDAYIENAVDHFNELFEKIVNQLGATKIKDFKLGELWSNHPMGTTCMGNNKLTSVIDKNCQSHDHPNLFIAGSAAFPSGGTANPTLTIAALSLRLANYIESVIQK